ncbi:sensor domain-containing diguanylate cyclase [Glaciecola sp. KUL10]|uniref:sensor domain-containing diguanylate cyclase n=1 Tax=Glaciecola sp. (strain KUL10) TaxID=2161813 RepID=UPI000D7828D4|nr:sensor domain-containing diguanylate cyclase [Glaciecola sp. KUL10]GBL05044.1 diguanylate cyclase [Glaciecola sp. KUL10]
MKLSLRISLTLAALSLTISLIVAGASYLYQLRSATEQNESLVLQLAQGAQRASVIAAYLNDHELANEILAGLINNDLIADAEIQTSSEQPNVNQAQNIVKVELFNPFMANEKLGDLVVYSNSDYIQQQATETSLLTAYMLLGLSFVTVISVGLFVRIKLTAPLIKLADEFLKVDVSKPNQLVSLDIGYQHKDEIGLLVKKVNSLISALQTQYLSEYELRKSTETLQRRFRLLFEQSTAGIGLLENDGRVNISNPAMNQLFGKDIEGENFVSFFETPELLQEHIQAIQSNNAYSQVGLDLVSYKGERKRYLHCLLSTIKDSRQDPRDDSDHLIEIMIYDVTSRRELEQRARYEADHDSLTGLMNRRSGLVTLTSQLNKARATHKVFAVMMIDLDRFKPINDDHGHDVGDVVLQKISERLSALTSAFDANCIRWGGDEFLVGIAIDCIEKGCASDVEDLATSLLGSLQQTIRIDEQLTVQVGASIGIVLLDISNNNRPSATVDLNEVTIENLIKKADELMYNIKQEGKNSFVIDHI